MILRLTAFLGFLLWLPSLHAQLVSSLLPASRSVETGDVATVFTTVINSSVSPGAGCTISPTSPFAGDFSYQATDPSSNTPVGVANDPFDIAAGEVRSFVLIMQPSESFEPSQVALNFECSNGLSADVVPGLNTLQLSASDFPVSDVIALSSTVTNDGVLWVPGISSSAAFAVAMANIGETETLTVRPKASGVGADLSICQTEPSTGACLATPQAEVAIEIASGETPTFAIFATAYADIPFAPDRLRIAVEVLDSLQRVRGATSVAVTTVPNLPTGHPTTPEIVLLATTSSTTGWLAWLPAVDDVTTPQDINYEIHISQAQNFIPDATSLNQTVVGGVETELSSLDVGTEYSVRLVAVDSTGNSSNPSRSIGFTTMNQEPVLAPGINLRSVDSLGIGDPEVFSDSLLFTSDESPELEIGMVLTGDSDKGG